MRHLSLLSIITAIMALSMPQVNAQNLTVWGAPNSSYNGTYEPSGTYNGETVYIYSIYNKAMYYESGEWRIGDNQGGSYCCESYSVMSSDPTPPTSGWSEFGIPVSGLVVLPEGVEPAPNLVVSGASSSSYNGTYVFSGTYNERNLYLFSDFNKAIFYESGEWKIGEDFGGFYCCEEYSVTSSDATPPSSGWAQFGTPVPGLLVIPDGRALLYSSTDFRESAANDGTISNSITITYNEFDGDFLSGFVGMDYLSSGLATVTNVPSGLTASLVLTASDELTLSLTGTASSSTHLDRVTNLTVEFTGSAFFEGNAVDVFNYLKDDLTVTFLHRHTVAASGADHATIAAALAASVDGDEVEIAAGTYTESGLLVDKSINIYGAGAGQTIVQAHAQFDMASNRVFGVPFDVDTVRMYDLTIRHGRTSGGANDGGGISAENTHFEMYRCRVSRNINRSGTARGGGFNLGSLSFRIVDCLVDSNQIVSADRGFGAGVYLQNGNIPVVTSDVINSTFTANSITAPTFSRGGGIYISGQRTRLINCTVNGNSAGQRGAGLEVYVSSNRLFDAVNLIAFGNTAPVGADFFRRNNSGPVSGYNSIIGVSAAESGSVFNGTSSNISSSDPLLEALADNGGPTFTHAIGAGSPAIDGSGAEAPDSDQRGYGTNGTRDIGAFEFDGIEPCLAPTASAPSGSGTQGDPYLISSLENLQWVAENSSAWDKYFRQTADIDAEGTALACYNSGEGWSPIGNSSTQFTGTYDGDGHSISNLFIDRAAIYQGLFGFAIGATFSDLSLVDVDITGSATTGGLVGRFGQNSDATIGQATTISVSGTVAASGSGDVRTGGLVGLTQNNVISSCSSTVNVSGDSRIGGLIGENTVETIGTGGIIQNCHATGTVTATGTGLRAGGLIGYANVNSVIEDSYATGAVSGLASVGGLIGFCSTSTVSDVYATGNVTATDSDSDGTGFSDAGGLVGDLYSGSTLTRGYATGIVTGNGRNVGGLIGYVQSSSSVTASYATGNVSITSDTQGEAGGLIGGVAGGATGSVNSCYATGSVSASSTGGTGAGVGGLIGRIRNTISTFEVNDCFSAGAVTASADAGGLIGISDVDVTTNCFWDVTNSGLGTDGSSANSAGGTGKSVANMEVSSTFTNASWDFQCETVNGTDDTWGINGVDNSGYPFLSWQGLYSNECAQWSGATSNEWSNTANWTGGVLPTGSDDVTILSSAVNDPTISNNDLNNPATCANLIIGSGVTLTVAPGQAMTITGDVSNEGTILVKADASGIGSLITMGSISGSGASQMEQYLTGSGGATPNGLFYYVGSPVGAALTYDYNVDTGDKLWRADETTQSYPQQTVGAVALIPMEGYVARMGSTQTITFNEVGSNTHFNTGSQTASSLTRTGTTATNRGYNLVSNPYPSTVSWNSASRTDLETTMWYRTHQGSTMLYDTYNATSSIGTNNNGGGAVTGDIPPTQAFWVRVPTDGLTGELSFGNADRSHGALASIYKVEAEEGMVRVSISNGESSDETIVMFSPDAQDGYDDFDSQKFWASLSVPQLYTSIGTDTLVINGLTSTLNNPVVDLGMKVPSAGEYTISANDITLQEDVWLEDRVLGTFQHLNDEPEYAFTSEVGGNIPTRFALHFNMSVTDIEDSEEMRSRVYTTNGNELNILLPENSGNAAVEVMDMAGRIVHSSTTSSDRTTIGLNVNTGVYLVRVLSENGMDAHRIILR